LEEDDQKKEFFLKKIYRKHYKELLIIPFLLFILALGQIGLQYYQTGDFLNKGVNLKGGITITIDKVIDIEDVQQHLSDNFPGGDISVRSVTRTGVVSGTVIEATDIDPELFLESIEDYTKVNKEELSVEVMGSRLGASFFRETFIALLIAFIFMGIVVFIYFRVPIPSLAVILAAFSDIIVTLAIVNIIGIKLSTAGIAAFLMLIGYSVDTDILLSTKLLKRKGGRILDRTFDAMKTGLTMSFTTMIALIVALSFAQSEVLKQIMTILLIGLLVDLINTWIQNAGILRWYLNSKKGRKYEQN